MPFIEEPAGYEKTILSDLQGAWSLLRQTIVDSGGIERIEDVEEILNEVIEEIPD